MAFSFRKGDPTFHGTDNIGCPKWRQIKSHQILCRNRLLFMICNIDSVLLGSSAMLNLQNWSIGRRIALAVSVPMLSAIGFGGFIIADDWRSLDSARNMAMVAASGPHFGVFIHELQIERGLTNTMMRNPQNQAAAQARSAQMVKVDAALTGLRSAVQASVAEAGSSAEAARQALTRTEDLAPLRQLVAAGSIEPAAAVGRYTAIVEAAMAPVEALARHSQVGQTARAVIVYSSMLRAKEAAGLERATGAGAFTSAGFAKDILPRFVALGAMQESFLAVAQRYGTNEQTALIQTLGRSPAAEAVKRLRPVAAAAALNGDKGVEPLEWFRISTAYIEGMKGLEERFASDLIAAVAISAGEARSRLVTAIGLVIAISLAAGIAAFAAARSITRPLNVLTTHMAKLARGDTSDQLPGADSTNEIGAMSRAVAVFRENALARVSLEEEAELERQRELQRQGVLVDLIGRFRASIADVVATVETETGNMRSTATTLTSVAGQASDKAQSARDASNESSINIQSVSAAAEELITSITEISTQIHSTTTCLARATEVSRSTDRDVSGLAELAQKIGAIIDMIRTIAEQTNLLALNATIEAARAGEAGRGFAIVAAEVKTLAGQTARATDEIAGQVSAIQSATHNAVAAIRAIGATVEEIDGLTGSIAAAVEEQSAATQEIAAAIARASDGSTVASENVAEVAGAIQKTSGEAGRVSSASQLLSDAAHSLAASVDTFLTEVAQDVKERRSAVRRRATKGIVALRDGSRHPVAIANISETGAKIASLPGLETGKPLTLVLSDGTEAHAKVVWAKDGEVGIQFDMPLSESAELKRVA
ncbi:methyl-accepting chemotaxis protein [Phreatobacter aquaticus]|uniref:methyl-accepting chemotaxis protein n=1 Tax=Phreatobacter aquaticus TaxID=2570229 RepID=UPI00143CC940|nr:nitrate- and nitrite sensing domain-containing protein [Phreatobacter aquaticus]